MYKRRWDATIGEVLQAEREEPRNVHDRYAVMLVKETVGLASYPGSRGGGGKREPGTDRLRMRLINSKFCRL